MEDLNRQSNRLLVCDDEPRRGAVIKVVGVGGGGCNAVSRMIEAKLDGVEFIACNTDIQSLKECLAPKKLQIGAKLTGGLGAGAKPKIGHDAALEDTERIIECLEGADLVFVTAGMGGGTGTGAAPIIAALARELGALAVAVVTKPFGFEGKRRQIQAESGITELTSSVDTIISIPNERLMQTLERKTTMVQALSVCDDVLRQAVQGITDLITKTGLINLDFADIKTIMADMGVALMGIGIGEGEARGYDAVKRAISNPLLEDSGIHGAKGIILNISGSSKDITMLDVAEASKVIHEAADPDANIIFGMVYDEALEGRVKVTVIATGFNTSAAAVAENPSHNSGDAHVAGQEDRRPQTARMVATGTDDAGAFPDTMPVRRPNLDEPTHLRKKAKG